ncbi:MAG TPA: hypothetical protein VGA36_01340 [Nitriliruptorales bacterium]
MRSETGPGEHEAETQVPEARLRPPDASLEVVARLAATRAALSRKRRSWRYDILVSAIVQMLDLYGPRTPDQLQRAIGRLWGARLPITLLEDGLQVAHEAHLIHPQHQRLDRQVAWALAEAVKDECAADRTAVEAAFREFAADLYVQVIDHDPEVSVAPDRALRLAGQMFAATAAATTGSYDAGDISEVASPSELRPVRLDLDRLRAHLRAKVQPRPVARAMEAAALKLVDPDHPLGSQVLHLLVLGNMAQCLLTSRDLHGSVDVSQHRILLDTSALVALAEEGTPQRHLIDELIATSVQAGVEVVVPDHVLAEWERLWCGADKELGDGSPPPWSSARNAYALAGNVIVRAYLHARRDDTDLSWIGFQIGRRDLRHRLEHAGVNVRPHGNHQHEDAGLVERVERRLLELSADPRLRAARTEAAAHVDAHSCAMVARWRTNRPMAPPCGWIIGTDLMTDVAYSDVAGGEHRYPLSMTPAAWMLYLSSVVVDDGDSVHALLHTLSDAATRDAFLSGVTTYRLDDVRELAEIVGTDDGALSEEDVRMAIETNLLGLLDEAADRSGSSHLREVGVATLRRRSARREARAVRAHRLADDREQDLSALVAQARVEERAETWVQARDHYRRMLGSVVLVGALVVGVGVGVAVGALRGWGAAAVGCGVVVVGERVHDYLRSYDRSLTRTGLAIGATLAAASFSAVLAELLR